MCAEESRFLIIAAFKIIFPNVTILLHTFILPVTLLEYNNVLNNNNLFYFKATLGS